MCTENRNARTRGLVASVLTNRCPRCREGALFTDPNPYHLRTTMRMPERCPECRQAFELQTGFYFGTGYVSYFLSVLTIMLTFALWYFTIGFSLRDDRLLWYIITISVFLILTQPVQQRLCRSIWIACFVRFDRELTRTIGQKQGAAAPGDPSTIATQA